MDSLKPLLSKKALQSAKNGRRVVFENSSPSGFAIYHDGAKITKFCTEVGGGNCIFYISVPSEQKWEKDTAYSLEKRNEIPAFVADESIKKKARIPGAYFKMNETSIDFYTPQFATHFSNQSNHPVFHFQIRSFQHP